MQAHAVRRRNMRSESNKEGCVSNKLRYPNLPEQVLETEKIIRDEEKSEGQLLSELIKLYRRVDKYEGIESRGYSTVKDILKTNEDKYQFILDNMEEAYCELDLSGRITFFNKKMVEMLGYSPDELSNMNCSDYVIPQTKVEWLDIIRKIYQTGEPAEISENQVIRKDSTKGLPELCASLILDSSQNPTGFRCLARDVTKRKLDEETIKKKDEELEQKAVSLAESKVALKVLLKQREEDKAEIERNVQSNVREIIVPYIEALNKSRLSPSQRVCVETLETNLINIISPFLRNNTLNHFHLTPKEFQVANLVKDGRTTKEIAEYLNLSTRAIDSHRNNIRKKFGLNNEKINLRCFLLSLS
jgi:PAS domain S-box-containing protein